MFLPLIQCLAEYCSAQAKHAIRIVVSTQIQIRESHPLFCLQGNPHKNIGIVFLEINRFGIGNKWF